MKGFMMLKKPALIGSFGVKLETLLNHCDFDTKFSLQDISTKKSIGPLVEMIISLRQPLQGLEIKKLNEIWDFLTEDKGEQKPISLSNAISTIKVKVEEEEENIGNDGENTLFERFAFVHFQI